MLQVYAEVMGAHFAPYIEQCLTLSTKLLTFYLHEDTRNAATRLIPVLLKDSKDAGVGMKFICNSVIAGDTLKNIWSEIIFKLNQIAYEDSDAAFLHHLFYAIAESIDVLGENCLNGEQIDDFSKACENQLLAYFQRCQSRKSNTDPEEDDDDEKEVSEEQENDEKMLNEVFSLELLITDCKCDHSSIQKPQKPIHPIF